MTPTIKAIETEYAGCRFRSRLEARWAVFFDHLGIRWEYEPEGLDIDGVRYLPDFRLPEVDGLYVEVKGVMDDRGMEKVLRLAGTGGNGVLVAIDIPRPGTPGPHFPLFGRLRERVVRWDVALYKSDRTGWMPQPFGWPGKAIDVDDPEQVAKQARRINALSGMNTALWNPPEVEDAFAAAKAARFEFGECG